MPIGIENNKRLVFLDLEGTGVNKNLDRITEIGVIVYENGKVTKTYSTLINPQIYIPDFIVDICGITNSMVRDAPTFAEISEELYELIKDSTFVAHNAVFDYGFICSEFKRVGINFSSEYFCTVKLSRSLYPEHKNHTLDHLIERLGIVCERRHRALDDAQAMLKFYERIHDEFPKEKINEVIKIITKKDDIQVTR